MSFKVRKILTEYGPFAAGAAALAVAVALAAIPSVMDRGEYSPVSLVFEDSCEPGFSEEKLPGCALYIDGKKIAVSSSEDALKNAVEAVATELSVLEAEDADTYELKSDISYESGEFLLSEFTGDVVSAVRSSSLSVYGVVTKNVVAVLDSPTVYRDNADMVEGRELVISEGSDGEIDEVYKLYYDGGKLSGSVLLSSVVTVEPVNTVVERGIKLASDRTLTTLSMFTMPYDGGISSEYGRRYLMGGTFHGGVDIAGKVAGMSCYGEPISSAGDGTVVEARYHGDFGNLVVIEHSNGIRTYYAHMSKILVTEGQTVSQGDVIGQIGSTGKAEGPHVHFEVRLPDDNGVYYRVDPKYYIINYSSYLRK